MSSLTRRGFLDRSNWLALAGLLPGSLSAAAASRRSDTAHTSSPAGEDYYDKLGVTKIINAAGTYTYLTASVMPDSVRQAVERAALHPVRLKDLQRAAGEYVANKLHCESALISAGASSALTLGTAASIMLANKDVPSEQIILRIPSGIVGLKNEVIVQKAHRYDYDHALLNCGIKFVEVETLAQYESAFTSNTVLTHFFNSAEGGSIGREDWIRIAHKHGVPCMNDAAADVPPISNLWNYTRMGFDLVVFSGGKGIRGPQNAGLLLGKKELITAAVQNDSPISETVGRGMKVAKEQVVGMVAAIDWLLAQSEEGMQIEFRRRADLIAKSVADIPTMQSRIFVPEVANRVPHLLLRYDPQRVGMTPVQVAEVLRRGAPSIEVNPATGTRERAGIPSDENTLVIGVWMLQDGEDEIVARRLREALQNARKA